MEDSQRQNSRLNLSNRGNGFENVKIKHDRSTVQALEIQLNPMSRTQSSSRNS